MENKTFNKRLKKADFIYVAIQLLLFLAYTYELKTIDISTNYNSFLGGFMLFIGILLTIIALLQLNRQLSPFPTPKNGSELIETGLYKFVRHPIYTGIISTLLGYALLSNSLYKIGISFLLLTLFFFKSKYEEKRLKQFFENYSSYRNKTGRFIPKKLLIWSANNR